MLKNTRLLKKVEEAERGTERFHLYVQSAPRPRYLAKEYALPRHCVFVKYKQKAKKKIQIQGAPYHADLAKRMHYLISEDLPGGKIPSTRWQLEAKECTSVHKIQGDFLTAPLVQYQNEIMPMSQPELCCSMKSFIQESLWLAR